MAKGWLIEVFGDFADAALLVLRMKGINASFGLEITRLVIYAVQIVSAILLGVRLRPKLAYLSKALQFNGAFYLWWAICNSAQSLKFKLFPDTLKF